ncbi:unnamed protein product [Caenorhabditis sp. 36 PRJEB53466]|nr:unnamed protein product [Caenorhabditis sp. 36 PRJEB53466]
MSRLQCSLRNVSEWSERRLTEARGSPGSEIIMMNALIIKSVLSYVEFSTVAAVMVVFVCALISYSVSVRRPLYYNLFIVEMHTWTARRIVQVLHLGQEFNPPVPWDRLVQRMRARAPRVQGEQRVAISDTNIVIQSPNTVIDSPAPSRSPDVERITLWDIEMPPPQPGEVPHPTRDSQYAAAAAIAILARGNDTTLFSRVFQNTQRRTNDSEDGLPNVNRARYVNPRYSQHDYVTTDVTYTTPVISPDFPHQITTQDLTQHPTEPLIARYNRRQGENLNGIDEEVGEEFVPDYDEDRSDEESISPEGEEHEVHEDDEIQLEILSPSEYARNRQVLNELVEPTTEVEIEILSPITRRPIASNPVNEDDSSEIEIEILSREDRRLQQSASVSAPNSDLVTETLIQDSKSESSNVERSEEKVLIRLKFLDDTEKEAYASLGDTVAKFKMEHFADLSNKVIRLIFQGQLLRDDNLTLQHYGLQAGSIVHCHISNIPYTRPGVVTLPPLVPDESSLRRRTHRSAASPPARIALIPPDHDLPPITAHNHVTRRAAIDRNQVYMLLAALLPTLSGAVFELLRPERIRQLFRLDTLLNIRHWLCDFLLDNGLLPHNRDEVSSLQTTTLFFIFGGQLFSVSFFFYYFPDVFDRVGCCIFIIMRKIRVTGLRIRSSERESAFFDLLRSVYIHKLIIYSHSYTKMGNNQTLRRNIDSIRVLCIY